MSNSTAIDILYKGKLFGVANLTLFVNSTRPHIISYELVDALTNFPSTSFLYGVKGVNTFGEFSIEEGITEENVEDLVNELVAELSAVYAGLNETIYNQEIAHGISRQ